MTTALARPNRDHAAAVVSGEMLPAQMERKGASGTVVAQRKAQFEGIQAKLRDGGVRSAAQALQAAYAFTNLRHAQMIERQSDAICKLYADCTHVVGRAVDRIKALEAEIAELRGSPKPNPETTTPATPAQPEASRVELALRGPVTRHVCDALIARIKAAAPQDEIVLRLTTQGGDHEASVDLCDALLERKGKVRTIAEGECLSAGTTIFMAGDKDSRLCTADASFLVHKGNWQTMASAWRNTFTEGVESAQSDQLAKLFSRRTGKSWYSFRSMMKTDEGERMDASRAHALGIASDILPARTRRSSKRKARK